jgi:hypothetical protein
MPRRALPRPALLHQHVIVVEADPRGAVSAAATAGTRECRASCSISGTRCQRQKSSVNAPGSSGPLATWASGAGLASTASIAAAATATSAGLSAERTHTTPSRANDAAPAASVVTGSMAAP